MSIHFYTITINGKRYGVTCGAYHWEKVSLLLGVPRSCLTRGAKAGDPDWYMLPVEERDKLKGIANQQN